MTKALRKSLSVNLLKPNTRFLLIAGAMFFFWAVADGTISFIAPILVTEHGFSAMQMGLVISSSSMFGVLFDVLMGRYLTNPHWRRIFPFMFLALALTGFSLWYASTLPFLILAMAFWGLYFNLTMFGMYDFVSVNAPEEDRGKETGILNVFRFLAYIFTPIVLGFFIAETVGSEVFMILGFGLGAAFLFYLLLARAWKPYARKRERPLLHTTLHTLWRDGGRLLPVMIFVILYNIVEAFFWTIGPLLTLEYEALRPWNGLFVTAYFLPMLLTGWFVGSSVNAIGKTRSAFLAMFFGSIILLLFFVATNPYALIGIIFCSALFTTFALPCINAAIADFIAEDRRDENHIESLMDFSSNTGYILGPALAGFVATAFGTVSAFGVLGIVALSVALMLLVFTPRRIRLMGSRAS